MAIQKCEDNGKPGWKLGDGGKCFTYDPDSAGGSALAKAKALKQAASIKSHGNANADKGQVNL